MKVGIFAWVNNFDSRYSVATHSKELIEACVNAGLNVVFLTRENFEAQDQLPPSVEVRFLPTYQYEQPFNTEGVSVNNLEEYAFNSLEALHLALNDLDVLLTEDIVFNPQFLAQLWALRYYLQTRTPKLGLVHWTHSLPETNNISTVPAINSILTESLPNSLYVSLSPLSAPQIAKRYKIQRGQVRFIPNWLHLADWWLPTEKSLPIIHDLLNSKTSLWIIYPTRLDRGKQPEKAIDILRGFEELGIPTCLVMAVSYLGSKEKQDYLQELKEYAKSLEVDQRILWAPDYGSIGNLGLERNDLKSLYLACDFLIHSSIQESFGLTILEAWALGCIVVCNQDVANFRFLMGENNYNHCYQRGFLLPWGSPLRKVTYSPDIRTWTKDQCRELLSYLDTSIQFQSKKHLREQYSSKIVFEEYILPAIEEANLRGKSCK